MSLLPWRTPSTSLSRTTGSPMSLLRQEMDDLFDRALGAPLGAGSGANFPAMSLTDTDDKVVVTAEMPGIDAGDLDIRVDNDILTLSGVKHEEKREEKENLYRDERIFGAFCRRVALPGSVDADKVKASLKSGVLRLEMPKTAGKAGKAIKIQAS